MQLTKTERKIHDLLVTMCRTGGHQISLVTLSEKSGVSRQSVKRAVRVLEQANMIAVHRSKLCGRQQANIYIVLKIEN